MVIYVSANEGAQHLLLIL